jgi:hypoxanthine phosphoribosyltransferase
MSAVATDLYVSWTDYIETIERLAARVHASGWAFNQVVCIARGGTRVGDILSRIFEMPLAITFTQSYVEQGGTVRGEIVVSKHMAMAAATLGDRVLLVDDLVDSGISLATVKALLQAEYPGIQEIRTAVLWYKAHSETIPDFYADYLVDNPWIHQPFERYDQMKADELDAG